MRCKITPMELTPSVSWPAWLDRFANRLGALLPGIDPHTASAHAESAFPDAADLTPEEAAEIFALEAPPSDV